MSTTAPTIYAPSHSAGNLDESDFRRLRGDVEQIRRFYNQNVKELRALHAHSERENRAFLPEEKALYDNLIRETERLKDMLGDKEAARDWQDDYDAAAPIGAHPDDYRASRGEHLRDERTGRSFAIWRAGQPIPRNFEVDEYGAPVEPGEVGLAAFLRGVAGMRTTESVKRNLQTGVGASGGFLLPAVVWGQVLEALAPASSLMQAGVGVAQLDEGAREFVLAGVDSLPVAAWRAENGPVVESAPTFRSLTSVPRSLAFRIVVSRELLQDAGNLESTLRQVIAQAMAVAIDAAGLFGSGTPPVPRGIRNTSGIHSITNGANGASLGTIRFANILSAWQAVTAANAPEPTHCIMAPRTAVGFGSLADSTNQPLRRPPMLEGLRFLTSSQVPVNQTVGTSTDCSEMYVGDFRQCLFLFRERPSVMIAHETRASSGQVEFYCHARLDFVVLRPAAIALVSGIRP